MADTVIIVSTLTDRDQTTVPEAVRRALQLSRGDKINYKFRASGEVVLSRAEANDDDPIIDHFIKFLGSDISKRRHHLQTLDAGFVRDIQSLVEGVEIDLNAPLLREDD
ncbi:MAG: type II toxin-antitoxin system PrlF family antitoxin [Pseudomonas sp.]